MADGKPALLSERTPIELGLAGLAGAGLVSLAFWVGQLSSHVSEHESKLAEHAASIAGLQKSQEEVVKGFTSSLGATGTDLAVIKEKLVTQGEALAEIKGSLRPAGAISLQSSPQPPPTPARRAR